MRILLALAVIVTGACSPKAADRKVRVAAAADLAHALPELAKDFKTRTGNTLELQFGSSGLLAKQIEQGAPFSLFAAANRGYVDQVIKAGRCDGATARSYARGRLVAWTPSGVAAPAKLEDLAEPRFRKIAIANPDQAPYGRAAKQALEKAGLWPRIQDRIVLGENVQATMVYARDHNADAAIIALSLALVTEGGASLPVDPALHAPLDQALVVCGGGEDAKVAQQFADFIASKEGREVMTRYGFVLAEDQAPPGPPQTPKTPQTP
jgi:molybdate transport system substrate-binding protein